MDYELYHDESRENGYWHGMLLIPSNMKNIISNTLNEIRTNTNFANKVSFKDIRGTGQKYDLAKAWIQIASGALRSKIGKDKFFYLNGLKTKNKYIIANLPDIFGAKFILFRVINGFGDMSVTMDLGKKVEITSRIGIKGGLHYLFDDTNKVKITRIHFDGHEHYRRRLNKRIIVDRLSGLRDYVEIDNIENIIDDDSSDHSKIGFCQAYEDCQFQQLTDLIIGCMRVCILGSDNQYKKSLTYPIQSILNRYYLGYARMKESRWFSSICMSESFLSDGRWNFQKIQVQKKSDGVQLGLPYCN